MNDGFRIDYRFDFASNQSKDFSVCLDRESLLMQPAIQAEAPAWTALDFHRCSVCTLEPQQHAGCPIALNMVQVIEEFQDFFSYEEVTVTVTTEERSYSKSTSLQLGLSPLLGIIMVSSGCPTMELLKPNVRFHLPFASLEEMTYRSVTMYLLAQFYRQKSGKEVDWSLEGLDELFHKVGQVNQAFAERLLAASKRDANVNALVNLHCLGEMAPAAAPEILGEMERYFSIFLET